MEPHLILGIGELLWDILPANFARPEVNEHSRVALLGGAPANFTVMAGRLGNHAVILSRIGDDDLGRQAMGQLRPTPIDTSLVEIDPRHETGRVTVDFVNGEPRYTIHEPAAWDFMELTEAWVQLAERAHAICFGSLAQRDPTSRQTIQALVSQTSSNCIRVFDVNLRAPFISAEVIEKSLDFATVVKMNEEELPTVLGLLGLPAEEPGGGTALHFGAARLLAEFPGVRLAAITRGSRGSLLVTRDEWDDHPGLSVQVADSIGAGDAFTAALTHYLLKGAPLSRLNDAGNRWGSWIASQSGAMPAFPAGLASTMAAVIER